MSAGRGKLKKKKVYQEKQSFAFLAKAYNPLPGVLKSGMPAETEMPAPHKTIMLLYDPACIPFAIDSNVTETTLLSASAALKCLAVLVEVKVRS